MTGLGLNPDIMQSFQSIHHAINVAGDSKLFQVRGSYRF